MQTRPFPVILVLLIIAIAIVNGLAQIYSWYWGMRWFDMPMHFAGGVWLAGVAVWWRYYRNVRVRASFLQILTTATIATIGIGLLWEVFEACVSLLTTGYINEIPDTLGDLLFDIIGGIVVSVSVWLRMCRD